jgi:hypothetical protein
MPAVTKADIRSKSMGLTEVRSSQKPCTANAMTDNPMAASAKPPAIRSHSGGCTLGVNKDTDHISTAKIPVTATGGIRSGRLAVIDPSEFSVVD